MPLYVYSITAKDHPRRLDGVRGVGSETVPLRTVTEGILCAVVSDISEEIRPKRRDLTAHQEVQERLMADGAVLPLQFGYIASDDLAVRQVLESNADGYLSALKRLEGCAEYHVRVSQADDAPCSSRSSRICPRRGTSTTGSSAETATRACRSPWARWSPTRYRPARKPSQPA